MKQKMGVIRPQNGSIFQPRMMHHSNWGASTHAVLIYLNSNRKKMFLILCAFMMGTWMGSLLSYSEQNRPNLPLCSTEQNVTNQPRRFPDVKNNGMVSNNKTDKSVPVVANVSLPFTSKPTHSDSDGSFSGSSTASPSPVSSNTSNCTVLSAILSLSRNASLHISNDTTSASAKTSSDVRATGPQLYLETNYESTIAANNSDVYSNHTSESGKFLVNSRGCKIPYFHPRDPSVQHAIRKLEPLSCGKPPLLSMKDHLLQINESNIEKYGARNLSMVTCCYHVIQRPSSEIQSDDEVEISNDCKPFFNKIYIREEYIKVRCKIDNDANTTVTDFYFTTPLKPEVEKRCGRVNFTSNGPAASDRYSVMLLGMDAVSRLNFQRHLTRTRKVLLDDLDAVEMLGYNKVGDNTFPNLIPVFTGMSEQELSSSCWRDKNEPFDECPWIWKSFAEVGYRTLYGEDSTQISCFNYLKEGFHSQPTDYYFRPFLQSAEQSIGWKKNLNTKLCLGSRPYHEVTFGWARRFMQTFPRQFYFGFVWSNSLTHDDANFVQMADDFLSTMLNDLHRDGHLNNTILIVLSDHGIRWGSLRETPIGRYEERLPALYVSVPKRFRDSFPEMYEMLRVNARRLTSPYDLHQSLLTILRLNPVFRRQEAASGTHVGMSLFEEIPQDRTCRQAGVNAHWCSCDETILLNAGAREVTSVAQFIVAEVNNLTAQYRSKCALFHLSSVLNAQRTASTIGHFGTKDATYYNVVLMVKPGEAKFEATVLVSPTSESRRIEGEISRLNLYGNQSSCISNRELKKYCYCVA